MYKDDEPVNEADLDAYIYDLEYELATTFWQNISSINLFKSLKTTKHQSLTELKIHHIKVVLVILEVLKLKH